jgi:hypothetical protein
MYLLRSQNAETSQSNDEVQTDWNKDSNTTVQEANRQLRLEQANQ